MQDREFLRVFRELNSLSTGRVGYAAVEVRDGEIWADACRRAIVLGESLRSELDELLSSATPLGRLSAAALLSRFDRAAGRAAFERLESDDGAVHYASGCTVISERVSDVARGILRAGLLGPGDPPPPPPHTSMGAFATRAIRDLVARPASKDPLEPWPGLPRPYEWTPPAAGKSFPLGLWVSVAFAMVAALAALYWLQN